MNLGMGVMLGMLSGNKKSAEAFTEAMGKIITALEITEKELLFTLDNGSRIKLFDDGQSCCESRYMHTDDDLPAFVGATLLGAEVRDGPSIDGEYDEIKDSEFLIVNTSLGQFTVVNYNEHNGYNGGFLIRCVKIN